MVCLDEFDKVLAFDDAARKLHLFATDAVQVVAEEQNDLVDFGIGGIVCQHDTFIPNKLPLSGFDLLWGREDMGVLREGAEAEKAEQDKEFGFHSSTTILSDIYCKITVNSDFNRVSIRNLLQNCNKIRLGFRRLFAEDLLPLSVSQYVQRFLCRLSKRNFIPFWNVPPKLAKNGNFGGILYLYSIFVRVDSDALRNEWDYSKLLLLKNLNELVGKEVLKEIVLN